MPNPQGASRPAVRTSKPANEERKAPSPTWVRPERSPLESGMLQNRKLDLPKTKRVPMGRRRP